MPVLSAGWSDTKKGGRDSHVEVYQWNNSYLNLANLKLRTFPKLLVKMCTDFQKFWLVCFEEKIIRKCIALFETPCIFSSFDVRFCCSYASFKLRTWVARIFTVTGWSSTRHRLCRCHVKAKIHMVWIPAIERIFHIMLPDEVMLSDYWLLSWCLKHASSNNIGLNVVPLRIAFRFNGLNMRFFFQPLKLLLVIIYKFINKSVKRLHRKHFISCSTIRQCSKRNVYRILHKLTELSKSAPEIQFNRIIQWHN